MGLFLDAREHGIGQVPMSALDLTVNFRSQTEVVRWVNEVFYQAFPTRDDIGRGAVRYSPSIAFNAPLEGEAVQFYGCLHQSDNDDADSEVLNPEANPDKTLAQMQEAESVAELAQQSLETDPEGTVAILVRSRPHLQWILPALARRGLHWQATEIDRLASRMAIVDLMSLTRALLNLDDRIAWLSILRAPWCGLDLHDLHTLINAEPTEDNPRLRHGWPVIWQQLRQRDRIAGLTEAGRRCLDRLMSVLEPAWRERQRKPLRQWLEGIWLALGGPALLADPGDAQDIPSYFNLLERHQAGGGLRDWDTFERGVESLFAAPRADADPRLQVMTLHKSKGLEFDTVIIPGLDRASSNDDKELLLWQQRISREGERQLLLGPLAPTGADADPLYQFMRTEARLRDAYEATRLLYVGCTRAIQRLHLLACITLDPRSGRPRSPRQGSLLRTIWEPVQTQMRPAPIAAPTLPPPQEDAADTRPGLQHLLRLPTDWQAPSLQDLQVLAAYRGREFDDEENLPERETSAARLARHTGTVLHNQLQRLTEQPLAAWSEEWAEQQRPFWRLQLRQMGWEPEAISGALTKIHWGLQQTFNDPHGQWVINPHHEDSQCEWAIHHRVGTAVQESVIDRSFVYEGARWIIDYKSSQPEAGQSVEAFLAQEADLYRQQLARYAQALRDLGEERPIKTALYFPLLSTETRLLQVET